MVDSGVSYPIRIRVCMKNKTRLTKEVKAMKESALKILKNAQDNSIVN